MGESQAIGEAVRDHAVAEMCARLGERVVAIYCLGSLARGGFVSSTSDVDLALILSDPAQPDDEELVYELRARVAASGLELADRLSLFWATPSALRSGPYHGRFPAIDVADLLQSGQLLFGRELRPEIPVPSKEEVVLASGLHLLRLLDKPATIAREGGPARTVGSPTGGFDRDIWDKFDDVFEVGLRHLCKRVQVPARLLFTAETGRMGGTEEGVAFVAQRSSEAVAELLRASLRWRNHPPLRDQAVALLRAGLLPLWIESVASYGRAFEQYGRKDLRERADRWADELRARDESVSNEQRPRG